MKQSIFIIFIVCLSCTQTHNSIQKATLNSFDSLYIIYDRESSVILRENAVHYRDYIKSRGADNTFRLCIVDSTYNKFINRILNECYFSRPCYTDYVDTHFLLLINSKSGLDTIAVPAYPGLIQIRDTIYYDGAIFYTITNYLAQNDSLWLNNSHIGKRYKHFFSPNKKWIRLNE